jgi:hypothetical protein
MKVSIPFIYQVDFKKPRQPRFDSADIICEETLDIEEIDGTFAPVVHVVSDSSPPGTASHGKGSEIASKFHVPGGQCLIRIVDGQHYASRFPVDDIVKWRGNREFDPFAAVVPLKHGESEHRTWWSGHVDSDGYRKPVKLNDFHAENPGVKKFSSDRAIAERQLVAFSKRFAVVDGMLYEKVHEPVLSVLSGSPVRIVVDEAISPSLDRYFKGRWRGTSDSRIRFGLDEYPRAFETAAAMAAALGTNVVAHAEVHSVDENAVGFRGDHEYLFSASRSAAKKFAEAVRFMPERTGVAVMSAANLLALHDRLTPPSLAAVRRMHAELRDYFTNHCHPLLQADQYSDEAWEVWDAFGDDWQERMARLEHALEHWDARNDAGLEWLDDALDALPLYDYPIRAIEITSQMDMEKLRMRWRGDLPGEMLRVDPSSSAIVVVEDFELRLPLSALVFDRHDLLASPTVFANGDGSQIEADIDLATKYVSAVKTSPKAAVVAAISTPRR